MGKALQSGNTCQVTIAFVAKILYGLSSSICKINIIIIFSDWSGSLIPFEEYYFVGSLIALKNIIL
jgi:hypothetical protein